MVKIFLKSDKITFLEIAESIIKIGRKYLYCDHQSSQFYYIKK